MACRINTVSSVMAGIGGLVTMARIENTAERGGFSLWPAAKGGRGRSKPGFDRNRRLPIEHGARLRVVNLQRRGETGERQPQHRQTAKANHDRSRDTEEARRAALFGGEDPDQFWCRQVGRVARQQYPSRGVGMNTNAFDKIYQVVDEDQAAAVLDVRERQR